MVRGGGASPNDAGVASLRGVEGGGGGYPPMTHFIILWIYKCCLKTE